MFRPDRSDARRRALLAPIALLLAALTACSSPDSMDRSVAASEDAAGEEPRTAVAAPEAGEATVGVTAHAGEKGGSSGVPFVTRPEASGGSSYEADTVLAVRYGAHEGYERVVLDHGTGDEPAVSDGTLGDALLQSFYVVRAPDGGMFVDVFARKSFGYRVLELSDPARLVVDFKPEGSPLKSRPPAVGGATVLVEPRAGARIGDPLTVCGYSRNFEASNTIVLEDSKGRAVIRRTVLSNDWTSTWGYFEATLDLPPFGGKGTLRVGTESARDGTFEGAEVPVKGS